MGAWGIGSFENDQAMDFVAALINTRTLNLIEECLNVDSEVSYLNAYIGIDIVTVCEVVAAFQGNPTIDLPEDLVGWVADHKEFNIKPLLRKCINLLAVVLSDKSELNILWRENAEAYPAWKECIIALTNRING